MADNGIGYTFAPGSQQIPVGGNQNNAGGPQSAVQVKSFTLPNRFVPGQIAPQALLQSPGGGGAASADVFRRLMSLFAPQGQQQGVPTLGGGQPGMGSTPGQRDQAATAPQGPSWSDFGGLIGAQPPPAPPRQDVPLTHTPVAPPNIKPGDTPDQLIGPSAPEPSPAERMKDLFGETPNGGFQNPLGHTKYEGFSF